MRFSIGGIFAQCRACGGNDFIPAFPLTPARRDVYVCAACSNESVYAELIQQIGQEAVKRAAEKREAQPADAS